MKIFKAKTKAKVAGNVYLNQNIVDFLLAASNSTGKTKYLIAVQLYLSKQDSGEDVSFAKVEHHLLTIDEKDFQDTQ